MNKPATKSTPPDQLPRERALDPTRSILVQAPAGSGKTDLLTRRFLRLLAQVEEPGQVVAITFTIAAAAEMRHRILSELEKAAASVDAAEDDDEFSMLSLARRALAHSITRRWNLLDLPSQLRISTIDSFCRELALQQPLLSGLGGGMAIAEQPTDLYRRAARATIEEIGRPGSLVSGAVERLLDWRDNNWQELEDLLVDMLSKRDRWMQAFVLGNNPDWEALRRELERPFANAVHRALSLVSQLLDQVHAAREEALQLARFACAQPGGEQFRELAELAEFPNAPFQTPEAIEEAHQALLCLAKLVLTNDGGFRKRIDKNLGFPSDRKAEKARLTALIASLAAVPNLEFALAGVRALPPLRYTEDDWQIVRACFELLRHAAGQLKVVFAESAAVDFIEVAQIAQNVLRGEDGLPTDAAMAVADGIRHLLVDEFQDTSRRQHQLLAGLVAAWPDRTGRTLFAVGDPMQSIYFFRDADAELFSRVKTIGLEIPGADPFPLDFVSLTANFRTTPPLVEKLNGTFEKVFAEPDGSGVTFTSAEPARDVPFDPPKYFKLNLVFTSQASTKSILSQDRISEKDTAQAEQVEDIVALIRSHQDDFDQCKIARERGEDKKYRIAVLARTRSSLIPIAEALREEKIPFRALDLEKLAARPEVLDALALARALLNPEDRVAWLGVLRAPWCGLTLADLHTLTSADDPEIVARPVPDLLAERLPLLSPGGQPAAQRVLDALAAAPALSSSLPSAATGTWLEQIWLSLGGADCCDSAARANLDLLWSCLDRLPGGQQDLLGPALDAALDKLTALPDPAASSDCGVQLMTIHKSKGLEFEVVIVPDLQAGTRANNRKLLSWLERGVDASNPDDPDGSGAITEFLVAPLPSKGEDSGQSKAWVDRVYRVRESQETRRILYVAATRARDELHLFARPTCKVEANGELRLAAPSVGLLATAWPALQEEVRAQFDAWKSSRQPAVPPEPEESEAEIASIAAAAAECNLVVLPSPAKPTLLRRLPLEYRAEQGTHELGAPSFPRFYDKKIAERVGSCGPDPAGSPPQSISSRLYARHQGGLVSRALGTAVHTLLEELARLRAASEWEAARAALRQFEPHIAAQVRASGIAPPQAARIAAEALQLALSAANHPVAQWILAPHPDAASELSWSGVVSGALTQVRVDRIFRAGLIPQSEGTTAWWIVDYKTAHADNLDPAATLPELRRIFAPQLEAYAQILRNLHGRDAIIRAGLYYPRMLALDWWEL